MCSSDLTNGVFQKGRCGNTHFPPNANSDYDYENPVGVMSDCMDWTPTKTGKLSLVNADTWGSIPYAWPEFAPTQRVESQHYIFWMQNMPGHQNGIANGTNVLRNWWEFTADWDNAIREKRGLQKPARVGFDRKRASAGNGEFRAALTGDAGFGYVLDMSENLKNWAPVATNRSFNGEWEFTAALDSAARSFRARRYP